MDTLIKSILDGISQALDPNNHDLGPKLAVGIACFGAALVLNELHKDGPDDRERYRPVA